MMTKDLRIDLQKICETTSEVLVRDVNKVCVDRCQGNPGEDRLVYINFGKWCFPTWVLVHYWFTVQDVFLWSIANHICWAWYQNFDLQQKLIARQYPRCRLLIRCVSPILILHQVCIHKFMNYAFRSGLGGDAFAFYKTSEFYSCCTLNYYFPQGAVAWNVLHTRAHIRSTFVDIEEKGKACPGYSPHLYYTRYWWVTWGVQTKVGSNNRVLIFSVIRRNMCLM